MFIIVHINSEGVIGFGGGVGVLLLLAEVLPIT